MLYIFTVIVMFLNFGMAIYGFQTQQNIVLSFFNLGIASTLLGILLINFKYK
jgi:hypothetical protein